MREVTPSIGKEIRPPRRQTVFERLILLQKGQQIFLYLKFMILSKKLLKYPIHPQQTQQLVAKS